MRTNSKRPKTTERKIAGHSKEQRMRTNSKRPETNKRKKAWQSKE